MQNNSNNNSQKAKVHTRTEQSMNTEYMMNKSATYVAVAFFIQETNVSFNQSIKPKQNAWTCFAISYLEQPKIATIQDSGLSHTGEV